MKRRVACALVLGAAAAALDGAPAPRPPNVVLISLDTLRADHLNCYGYAARQLSPNIDALAAEGVLFENHIASSPWTTPSHMSLFTGLSPSSHGLTTPFWTLMTGLAVDQVDRLPAARVTLAEALAAHGYATAAFTGGLALDPRLGFDQGFARYDTSMFKLSQSNMDAMYGWIRETRARPFFLFFHTFETHFPYLDTSFIADALAPEAAGKAREVLEAIRRDAGREGYNARLLAQSTARFRETEGVSRGACEALYDGGIRSADGWVGQLVAALRREGLYEDTLLLLTSDHGEEFGDHDSGRYCNSHGLTLYDEMVRIPLVVKMPRGAHAGRRVRPVTRAIDVFPTIVDVLGLPRAEGPRGRSLRALWEGRAKGPERTAFVEAIVSDHESKGARTARYKYIVTTDAETVTKKGRHTLAQRPGKRELYDVVADPLERDNLLAAKPSRAIEAVAERLHRALAATLPERAALVERKKMDPEVIERLKALGYVK
jgi:arylsulfatase A-like enzyme